MYSGLRFCPALRPERVAFQTRPLLDFKSGAVANANLAKSAKIMRNSTQGGPEDDRLPIDSRKDTDERNTANGNVRSPGQVSAH